MQIGSIRALDLRIIENGTNVVYEGPAEGVPDDLKAIHYSGIKIGSVVEIMVER